MQRGFAVTQLDLNDSGIWVTRTAETLLGRFNYNAGVLDGSLFATSNDFDVLQDGRHVVLVDATKSEITTVNTAQLAGAANIALPAGSKVAMGGGNLAIYDPSAGQVWTLPTSQAANFSPETMRPALEDIGKDAELVVGTDGATHVLAPTLKAIYLIPAAPSATSQSGQASQAGKASQPQKSELKGLSTQGPFALTAVGAKPVIWDATAGQLSTDRGEFAPANANAPANATATVPAPAPTSATGQDGIVLQQVGTDTGEVVYATADGLVRQPLAGGTPTVIEPQVTGGVPSPAVVLGGCVYQVWSGTRAFVRDCAGTDADSVTIVEQATADDTLRFRTNYGRIVLNQVAAGGTWLVTDDLVKVDDWAAAMPTQDDADNEDESKDEAQDEEQRTRPEENHPPTALDDSFGVRAGRSVVLQVVVNDSDTDGDLLTVAADTDGFSLGKVQPVYGDTAFLLEVPAEATGAGSFTYTVSDGRGGQAGATVNINVRPPQVNAAPQMVRSGPKVPVGLGEAAQYDVLGDWMDPDGDDIFLMSAVGDTAGDVVRYQADGSVAFQDAGLTSGLKTVQLAVTDGIDQGSGEMFFDVRPAGNQPPRTVTDHGMGRVGASITVDPLANDSDANGDQLRLVNVSKTTAALVEFDATSGTVTVTSDKPQVLYLDYTVTDGPATAQGLIRIDAVDPAQWGTDPVAVPDTALLPAGSAVLVGALDNDTDPAGAVLVLTAVSVPDGAPISVAVLDHAVLRVTELRAFAEPVVFTYTVSNGPTTAVGSVTVVPVPAPVAAAAPVVAPDEVRVRAGDVATVDVLANDSHPNNLPLELDADLPETPDADTEALVFVADNKVRLHARTAPGTYYAMYQARAEGSEPVSGQLTIYVIGPDPERNSAPQPLDLEVRAVTGAIARVAVPLAGIDPDGDRVVIQGVGSAPAQGRIVSSGAGYFEYEPGDQAVGADQFTYIVADRLGAQASATVRLGIASRPATNQAPVATNDEINVRPSRRVAVPVLVNDTEPDGDTLTLVPDSATSDTLEARIVGERVTFTSPAAAGVYHVVYTVQDQWGAQAAGTVVVTVSDDAPLVPPAARDDEVAAAEVLTQDFVVVAVLDNDEDADGSTESVEITVDPAAGAELLPDRTVRVPVLPGAQVVDYSLTDQDSLVGRAFIEVPGAASTSPVLNPQARSLQVKSGEQASVLLEDYVLVGAGKSARITEAAKVTAWKGQVELVSATEVLFSAPTDYQGAAGITMEVTDGTGPDDPDGLKGMITIPVTILPADAAPNQPPTVMGSAIEVAAGGEAVLALAPLVVDPDEADTHTFEVSAPNAAGLTARVDGSELRLTAADDAAPGTKASLTLTVQDGQTAPVSAELAVTVASSTAPRPVAVDDTVDSAHQGQMVCVPVLANDINPFTKDKPLTVTAAVVESGAGSAQVACGGVEVTPGPDFYGSMVVRYTIADATKDPAREVDGRIRLAVLGRPDPPVGVAVERVRSREVVLSWRPPDNNGGSLITQYTVESVSGPSFTKNCGTQTQCTLEGLTNNSVYRFAVTATNVVGPSEPSTASAEARPDAVPNTPAPPTLRFGDRSLTITWANPGSEGSPVASYDLEISPPGPDGARRTGLGGTSYTWTGLDNGTAYVVKVCARNNAPGVCELPDHWSAYSSSEIPAGVPGAPAQPSVGSPRSFDDQARAEICWSAPNSNGAAISAYAVTAYKGGEKHSEVTGSIDYTCQEMALPPDTTDYTFTVKAKNKAGWGAESPVSTPFRAMVVNGFYGVEAESDHDGYIQVKLGGAAGAGFHDSEVSYGWWLSNGTEGDWPAGTTSAQIPASNTGGPYELTVLLRIKLPPGVAAPAIPDYTIIYGIQPSGTPFAPGVSATPSGSKQVSLSWVFPSPNGRPVSQVQISIDGGAWQNQAAGGSILVGDSYGQTHSIKARAVDALGRQSAVSSASATSPAAPAPRVWLTRDDATTFTVNTSNFPSGTYRVDIYYIDKNGQDHWFDCAHASDECAYYDFQARPSVSLGGMGVMNNQYAPTTVWVVLSGWGESERMWWEKW
jgi:hypothetical protein